MLEGPQPECTYKHAISDDDSQQHPTSAAWLLYQLQSLPPGTQDAHIYPVAYKVKKQKEIGG